MSIVTDIHNKYKSLANSTGRVSFKQNDFADAPNIAGGFGHFLVHGLFPNSVGALGNPPQISLTPISVPLLNLEGDSKLTIHGQTNSLFFSVATEVTITVTEVAGHVHVVLVAKVITSDAVPIEVLDWIKLIGMQFDLTMSWDDAAGAFELIESKSGNFPLSSGAIQLTFSRPEPNQWQLALEQSGATALTLADIGKILHLENEFDAFLPQSFKDTAAGKLAVQSMAVTIDTASKTFQNFSLNIALTGQRWSIVPGLVVDNIETNYLLARDNQGQTALTAIFSGSISGHDFALTGVLNSTAPWSASLKQISVTSLFDIFLPDRGASAEDFFGGTLLNSPFDIAVLVYFQEHSLTGPDGKTETKPAHSFDINLDSSAEVEMGGSLTINELGFLFTPKNGDPNDIEAFFLGQITITLDGSENIIALKAKIPKSKTDSLSFEGSLEMSEGIPVGQFVNYLISKGFGVSLPGSLEDFSLVKILLGYTLTPRSNQAPTANPVLKDHEVLFSCTGALPLDGDLSLNPTIAFNYKKEAGNPNIEILGQLELVLEEAGANTTHQAIVLDLKFASNPADKSFSGSLFIPEDKPVKMKTLVGHFDQGIVDFLPDFNLPIPGFFLAYTKDANAIKGKLMLGARPIAGLQFSDLPLVGNALPDDQEIGVTNLMIVYTGGDFSQTEVTKINGLLPSELQIGDAVNPSGAIKKGVQIVGKAQFGPKELSLFIPIASSSSTAKKRDAAAPTTAINSDQPGKWFKVAKQLGPLYLSRVGFGFPESRLTIFLEAELALGPLTLAMYGFSIGSKLDAFKPVPGLQGFGLSFVKPPLEISGMFMKIGADAPTGAPAGVVVSNRFAGAAVIKTSKLSISAIGEYATTNRGPSFYLFAYIGYPLGGPAFFFVEGLALGFGFNRSVRLPHVSEINKHPFVAIAMEKNASLIELAETLISGNYVPISPGTIFLAIGIRFTTFKILDSFALVVASFGNSFRLDLMGVSKLVLPPGAKEVGAPPLAEITLNLSATFAPDEGFFGMQAQLTSDSYILSRDCTLQGGFAFYSWFTGSDHEGDFVLTLGGYHPRYQKPKHYPIVPRLGFNWQVSKEVSIKGGMYFALTPTCVMAGGRLEAIWKSGGLKAWFIIGADFLISWKPYFYDINLYLQFGVSYTFWFFGQQTISVELGADLHIWGPEFSGIAKIDIGITSFEVEFGAGAALNTEALDWKTFRESFIPAQVLGMTAVSGLIKETADGSWIVDPDKLIFEIESAVPNKIFKIEKANKFEETPAIGAGPMLTGNLNTDINVELDELEAKHFSVEKIKKSLPAAVWGDLSNIKPAVNPSKRLIPGVVSGMRFTVNPPTPPDNIASINADFLAFNEDPHGTVNNWETIANFQIAGAPTTSAYHDILRAFNIESAGQVTENDLVHLDLTFDKVATGVY